MHFFSGAASKSTFFIKYKKVSVKALLAMKQTSQLQREPQHRFKAEKVYGNLYMKK